MNIVKRLYTKGPDCLEVLIICNYDEAVQSDKIIYPEIALTMSSKLVHYLLYPT